MGTDKYPSTLESMLQNEMVNKNNRYMYLEMS